MLLSDIFETHLLMEFSSNHWYYLLYSDNIRYLLFVAMTLPISLQPTVTWNAV